MEEIVHKFWRVFVDKHAFWKMSKLIFFRGKRKDQEALLKRNLEPVLL